MKLDGYATTIGMDDGLASAARGVDGLADVVCHIDHDAAIARYQLQDIRARDVRLAAVRSSQRAAALSMHRLRETSAQDQYGNDSHARIDETPCGWTSLLRPPQRNGAFHLPPLYRSGTSSSATMLMILMSGFTAGPAVSL